MWAGRSLQIHVRKVLFRQAFSRFCLAITPLSLSQQSPLLVNARAGSTLVTKSGPPPTAPISRGQVMLHAGQPTYTDSSGYIQKWAVHGIFRGLVRAAGKPSDEPLCKGEAQSPTITPCLSVGTSSCWTDRHFSSFTPFGLEETHVKQLLRLLNFDKK